MGSSRLHLRGLAQLIHSSQFGAHYQQVAEGLFVGNFRHSLTWGGAPLVLTRLWLTSSQAPCSPFVGKVIHNRLVFLLISDSLLDDRIGSLPGSDPHHLFDIINDDLAVTGLAGMSGLFDHADDLIQHFVVHHALNLG